MMLLVVAALLRASPAEIPDETWRCRNQVEVWCASDGCAATPDDQFTAMDIHATTSGELTVCAYTGCWEAPAAVSRRDGRLLWTAEGAAFSTAEAGAMTADITLLIIEREGVGFVRAGGLATPLLCLREAPAVASEGDAD